MSSRDVNLAAVSRPLPLLPRADLEIVAQSSTARKRWAIKDAVSQRYWHIGEEEHFLMRQLDGHLSLDDLCKRFAREFAPRRLSAQQLTDFLAHLHREGLIVSDQPGHAEAIFSRQRHWRRTAPLRVLHHLLVWRFRGIDPDRWLTRVTPRLGWIFSAWSAGLFALLIAGSVLLGLLNWPALDGELAELAGTFTADQAFLVIAAIGIAKMLHELGHAVACKHFGGECHELGLMLFCGAPSLYCNVSDAWMLPQKWRRILVGAAGMMVELALASICAWLWWWSYPGLLHSLALYIMAVCSVNTLLVNGNPLLQYDGYYVLADLTDTPNLRAESRAAFRRLLARTLVGLRIRPDAQPLARQAWLILYAIASTVYRVAIAIGVAWFLHEILEPYGAQFLGWMAGAILSAALVAEPAADLVRFVRRPGWDDSLPWRWVAPRACLFAAGCLLLLLVPLPASVVAPFVLEPRAARTVYVEEPGRLLWSIGAGTRVKAGDALARLENLPLAAELARLTGEQNVQKQRLKSLLRRQADPQAASQIPTAEKSLVDVQARLLQRQRDFERLVIRAPRAGVVMPPSQRTPDMQPAPGWTGTPLEPANRGCYLQTGDVICVLGEPHATDAILFVAQGDEELVHAGQHVQLLIDSFPQRTLSGTMADSPTTRAREAPEELLVRDELPTEQDHRGRARPQEALFTARIELAQEQPSLMIGGVGRAKVTVASRSLVSRMLRSLGQTFREL